jgi:hypothetical protein
LREKNKSTLEIKKYQRREELSWREKVKKEEEKGEGRGNFLLVKIQS